MAKAIIENILYDTDKCKLVLEVDEWKYTDGVTAITKLYRGRSKWFIERNGKIYPITENRAKEIIAENAIDKYVEYFGEPEEA